MPRSRGIAKSNRKHVAKSSADHVPDQKVGQKRPRSAIAGSEMTTGAVVSELERRLTIKALWVAAGKPNATEWKGKDGTVQSIVKQLCPFVLSEKTGHKVVLDTLKRCAELDERGINYLSRFGAAEWRAKVKASSAMKKYTDVRDLMVWTKEQGDAIFKGTTWEGKWWLWRDGLKQWWELEAQEFLGTLGLRERQVRCIAPTNVGTIYEGKIPGDRPSFMPLDDCLYLDFKRSRAEHVAATFDLKQGDPRKCSMANPMLALACGRRVWKVCPTPERILQDIDRLCDAPGAIQAVIAAKGCVVEDEKRDGHRAKRARMPPLDPDAKAVLEESEAKFGGC